MTVKAHGDCHEEALTPEEEQAVRIRISAIRANYFGPIPDKYQGVCESAKAARLGYWICSDCGELNKRNFCTECGAKKPDAPQKTSHNL